MQHFRSIVTFLFVTVTLLISGCNSIYEISHPIEVKKENQKAQEEKQLKRKTWFINAEPQKKLSLSSLKWQPYAGTSIIKDDLKIKRIHIPSPYQENSTDGYLLYIAEYAPTNSQTYCDTAITTDVGEKFCSGETTMFTSKKENGTFVRSYYSNCRSDVFKKIYMTNYHCSKETSTLFGLYFHSLCYSDNDHMGPYPTEHAKDMANQSIDNYKKQDKINLVYYERCFFEPSGAYYVNYLAENTKKNEAEAKKIFDSIHFNVDHAGT